MNVRPPIGTRFRIAWGDGTSSGVTVVPTGKAVPDGEVNVMRDGDGSITTVSVDRPGSPDSEAAFAAIQRVEEILDAHANSEWARLPQTQEIRDAIADIDTQSGGWEPVIG